MLAPAILPAHDIRSKSAPKGNARSVAKTVSGPVTNSVVVYRTPTNATERAAAAAKAQAQLKLAGMNEQAARSVLHSVDWSKVADIPVATNKVVVSEDK